ncbi:MAG: hypothetical protein BWY76_00683 [bacterium ADurb.Bin429]|nr:MAG: hypothetical protein BWY76_00683 [bacterium ADurb.Bin429]
MLEVEFPELVPELACLGEPHRFGERWQRVGPTPLGHGQPRFLQQCFDDGGGQLLFSRARQCVTQVRCRFTVSLGSLRGRRPGLHAVHARQQNGQVNATRPAAIRFAERQRATKVIGGGRVIILAHGQFAEIDERGEGIRSALQLLRQRQRGAQVADGFGIVALAIIIDSQGVLNQRFAVSVLFFPIQRQCLAGIFYRAGILAEIRIEGGDGVINAGAGVDVIHRFSDGQRILLRGQRVIQPPPASIQPTKAAQRAGLLRARR